MRDTDRGSIMRGRTLAAIRWAAEHAMTLFEYLAIAFSLVLSSSAMRLIRALSHALQRDRRYWV